MPSVRLTPAVVLLLLALSAASSVRAQVFAPGFDRADPQTSFTPRDRRLQGHLEQVQRTLDDPQGDHRGALESLQQLIDQAEDVFADAKMQQSLRGSALELLSTLPEPTRRVYEETFGPAAAALLQTQETDRTAARLEVVRRYFHTSVGGEAAYQLAAAEMDRGRLLAAARLLEQLRRQHAQADRFEPQLSQRLIVCYWRTGQSQRAAEVLARTAKANPDLSLLDQPVGNLNSVAKVRDWLEEQFGQAGAGEPPAAPHWLVPHGSSSRNASVAAVSPLYDDGWRVPLIGSRDAEGAVLVEELSSLLEAVTAAGVEADGAAIPALAPVVVGDTVVFASYGLVKAVALESGRLRWVALPADHTFSDLLTTTTGAATRRLPEEMADFLLQRAWLDAASSQISSDGERVYAVRDGGMIGGMVATPFSPVSQLDHPRQTRGYNALRAYDAAGGSWLWEAGGPRTRVASPLAGTYFLGPPLAVDGTLYVLGEDLGQVRLHAVDPRSGKPLWSVPLANSDSDIEEDLNRRLAGLSPTLAGGLLICPTGSGLVVAVDPLTRTLQWGTRYREPTGSSRGQQFRRGPFIGLVSPQAQHVSVSDLLQSSRWHDAGVVAAGSALLVAAPDVTETDDQRQLLCLNLADGSTRWQRGRGESLYVGGVYHETILLVGQRHVEGVSLADARTLWSLPIDRPCGRGVRSGGLYHLPLASGEIATIDIAAGRVLARSPVRSGAPLGNLIAVDGRIVSLSPAEIRSFRPRQEVLEQIARDLEQQPESAAALAARGELRLHSGDIQQGLDDLRQAISVSDDPRARQLLVATLLEGLRSDFAVWRSHVAELERLTTQPSLRSEYLLTYAQGLIAAGETPEGFRQYLKLLRLIGPDAPLDYVGDDRRIRRDRRILGELAELYTAADEAARDELEKVIADETTSAAAEATDPLPAMLIATIPALRAAFDARSGDDSPALREHTEDLIPTRQEARLLAARRSTPPAEQAVIAARLVELYAAHGRAEPVISLLEELESVRADQPCLDDRTAAEWAAQTREREPIAALLQQPPDWPTGHVDVRDVREGVGHANLTVPLRREGPFDPQVSPFVFLSDSRGQVSVCDGFGRPIAGGEFSALPGSTSSFTTQYVMQQGHRAVVFQGTQFKLVDLLGGTPRVILEDTLVAPEPADIPGLRMHPRQVLRQQGFRGPQAWSQDPGQNGSVGPLNDSVFCYLRAGTLHAHDPFTGERFWSTQDVPEQGAEIFADEHFVFLVPHGQNVAHLYRTLDGVKLGMRTLPPDVIRNRRGADWGRYFLRLGVSGQTSRLAMYDPVSREDLWEREVRSPFSWSPRDGYDLCLVDSEGKLRVLDPLSGDPIHELDVDLPERLYSIAVLSLPDRWLLTTYQRPQAEDVAQLAGSRGSSSAVAVNGPVIAFRRHTAEPIWSRSIVTQMLSPEFPSRWPILPLSATLQAAARAADGRPTPRMIRRIELIDLQTGDTLHVAETAPGNIGNLEGSWQIDEAAPQLRLQYGEVHLEIRFASGPVQDPAALPPAEGPPPPSLPRPLSPQEPTPREGLPAPPANDAAPLPASKDDAPPPPE